MSMRPIGYILGFLIVALAAAMAAALLLSIVAGDHEASDFVAAIAVTGFVGGSLILGLRHDRVALDRRQSFVLTTLAWTILPLFGALPLLWSGHVNSFHDAVFESVSGLTTTGSTVLTGLDATEPSILFWRSMLQWVGGIGIIAMGIAILPFLRVGGMQVYRTESSDLSEKIVPRAAELARLLLGVYAGLTLLCALAYWAAGMALFEAVNHAMTTISTGGYSTSDSSIGHFRSPAVEWIGTLFMISGAVPFVLYISALTGQQRLWAQDRQARMFLALLAAAALVIGTWLWARSDFSWLAAVRHAAFNVTSVVTTTGFASTDYLLWGPFAVVAFYFLTYVGGCSGSTAGGLKIYRLQLLGAFLYASALRLARPHASHVAKFGGRPITPDLVMAVETFAILYFLTVALLACGLGALGLDWATALSGAATAVANVGPGVGPVIGPAGNFASLPDLAKWLLCAGMILGRLEILTVAVLAVPDFWKR